MGVGAGVTRIIRPSPGLSDTDKRILNLLSIIITESLEESLSNKFSAHAVLSDAQARELLRLLQALLEDERFLRKLAFANLIADTSPSDISLDIKLVRLTGKRPIGAGIGMTSASMRKWRVRLGALRPSLQRDPSPMTFAHFVKMEQKLLEELEVDPRVIDAVLRLASHSEPAFRRLIAAINGAAADRADSPRIFRLSDFRKLTTSLADRHLRELPKDKAIGLFTLISNTTVIFTTRDWGVAGTISTMCGGLAIVSSGSK